MQMFDSFLNLRIVLRINIHGIELVDRVLWSRLRGMVSWNGFVERTSWNGLRGTGFVERASWNGLRGTAFVERASWNGLRGIGFVEWFRGMVLCFSSRRYFATCETIPDISEFRRPAIGFLNHQQSASCNPLPAAVFAESIVV
jgi:hypothetical protein